VKKISQRMCVVCKAQKNKNELLRVVKNNENEIKIDNIGKEPGRGAYICYSEECLEKAIKSKRLEKSLETKIEEEIYENMRNIIIKKNGGDVIG
jgi:hypothetical protein